MYGNLFDEDSELSAKQHILPKILDKISQDFSIKNSNFNCDNCKFGAARRTFEGYRHLLCYTLEISIWVGWGKKSNSSIIFSEKI